MTFLASGRNSVYGVLMVAILLTCTAVLYVNNAGVESNPQHLLYLSVGIMLVLNLAAVCVYLRRFQRTRFYLFHGVIFMLLTALAAVHAADFVIGREMIASRTTLARRVVDIQVLAAIFLVLPALLDWLIQDRGRVTHAARWHAELAALFLFVALYPAQHYITNNVEAFSPQLAVQFVLIACSVPLLTSLLLHVYLRPVATDRVYYAVNLLVAIGIFSSYMKPLYQDLSILASEALGMSSGGASIAIPVFIVLFLVGYGLRPIVVPFLSLVLALNLLNLGYTLYAADNVGDVSAASRSADRLVLQNRPSIYMLVVDGYLNIEGLRAKGFDQYSIGPELEQRGFRLYEKAYSNYKPSVQSLRSFFEVEHHYYGPAVNWQALMTGKNRLYSILRANGYYTAVAHPSDYLLQGNCFSAKCYPASSVFGEIGFILDETIHYKKDFTRKTAVGKGKYRKDLYRFIEQAPAPAMFYSHFLSPSHGPRGCVDPQPALDQYEQGLQTANEWISGAISKVESVDKNALILVLGDHGAMIADNCTRSNPNVDSVDSIIDNLGVLMAVRWPADYDGRNDADIHSLLDLSWYLLQYLSGDAMDANEKPASASYLMHEKNGLVYKVVEDGVITPGGRGFAPGE